MNDFLSDYGFVEFEQKKQLWSEPRKLDRLNTIAHKELSPVLYRAHTF